MKSNPKTLSLEEFKEYQKEERKRLKKQSQALKVMSEISTVEFYDHLIMERLVFGIL